MGILYIFFDFLRFGGVASVFSIYIMKHCTFFGVLDVCVVLSDCKQKLALSLCVVFCINFSDHFFSPFSSSACFAFIHCVLMALPVCAGLPFLVYLISPNLFCIFLAFSNAKCQGAI